MLTIVRRGYRRVGVLTSSGGEARGEEIPTPPAREKKKKGEREPTRGVPRGAEFHT